MGVLLPANADGKGLRVFIGFRVIADRLKWTFEANQLKLLTSTLCMSNTPSPKAKVFAALKVN